MQTKSLSEINTILYVISRKVYEGECGFTQARDEIARQTNVNPGTAITYITAFSAMINGDRYTRTIPESATRYFLLHIRQDYGEAAFRKAVESCRKHATYYGSLGYGKLRYVENIVEEFSKK